MTGSVVTRPVLAGRSSLRYQLSAWVPVVICILVIATESTPYFGADHTSGPLQRICEFLLQRHFTGTEWWRIHIIIRKCGHFTGYGILSIAWFRAFWMTWTFTRDRNQLRFAAHSLAMLGAFLTASCDEAHQHFLPNRNGSFRDVMIDCAGALVLQLVVWTWMQLRFRNSH